MSNNSVTHSFFRRLMHIRTRDRPERGTPTVTINKRNRAPNRSNMNPEFPIGQNTLHKTKNTIATQTVETINIGKGREPDEAKQLHNPFKEINYDLLRQYLKKLQKCLQKTKSQRTKWRKSDRLRRSTTG